MFNKVKNIKYQKENRVIPFPFHMLRSVLTLNIVPKNYTWEEFYDYYIDLLKYSFSAKSMYRRFKAIKMAAPRWLTLLLSLSVGGLGKIRHLSALQERLRREPDFQQLVKRETNVIPASMIDSVRKDLGPLWHWLPEKSFQHDPNRI